jgi:AhpD family alkylhydroperoxidase
MPSHAAWKPKFPLLLRVGFDAQALITLAALHQYKHIVLRLYSFHSIAMIPNLKEFAMSKSFTEITSNVSKALGVLHSEIPETMKGFSAMAQSALAPGVIGALEKELIALGIGVAARCDACIGFHVKALIKLGVTRPQLMEVLGIATYMGGGPSLMYAAEAVRAYEEFTQKS